MLTYLWKIFGTCKQYGDRVCCVLMLYGHYRIEYGYVINGCVAAAAATVVAATAAAAVVIKYKYERACTQSMQVKTPFLLGSLPFSIYIPYTHSVCVYLWAMPSCINFSFQFEL